MGDSVNTVDVAPKKSRFKSIKSEFKKIVWPDKKSLTKQSIAVVVISIILGIIIAIVDAVFNIGIDWLLR